MKAKKHKARSNQNTRISQAMQAPEQMDIVNRHAAGIDAEPESTMRLCRLTL